jgi:hypothetical protein
MELIGLLAIGIVIGIPVIAIVALVRSRAAERRIEESWYKISDLQGDIAGLRRDLTRLSGRVSGLEASAVAPRAEVREEGRASASYEAVVAPAVAEEVKSATAQSHQPIAAASRLEEATVPLRSRPETATTAAISIEANEQSALGDIGAFEAPVQREGFKDEEILPAAPVRTAERPANQPVPAAPVPASPPSFAAYQPATPRESIFRRLKTNLPLEQFLGMNLFAKVGIVLLVLGLALLGRMALIARGRVCVWRSLTE